jgi:hypothetical protein
LLSAGSPWTPTFRGLCLLSIYPRSLCFVARLFPLGVVLLPACSLWNACVLQWLQQALGRSGHIPSPLARPLPTTPRANYPHAGGGGRSPYINVSGGGTGPLGPRVTQDAWNGGGAGMLDELGMGESGTGYAEGTGSGYTDFSAQRGTRKEAPTPPPRNASAQKRVPHVQDRVNL